MSNFNFVEIHNPTTNHSKIVADHSDQHFFEGYTRLVRYVPNHEIDIFEQDAIADEDYLQALANSADPDAEIPSNAQHSFEQQEDTPTDDDYHNTRQVEIY